MALKHIARQANLEADVRFLPQVQALLQLADQERGTYRTTVRQARGTAAGIKASARAARPVVRRDYGQAEHTRLSANALANHVLAGLPVDSPFRAAFGIEDAGARTRFAESRVGALHELTQRALEAESGRAYAVNAAGQARSAALGKIGQQLVGLGQQRGAFTSAAINDLLDAARKDRTTRRGQDKTLQAANARVRATKRGQDLQHGDRQATLDYKRNHPTGAKSKPRLTKAQQGTALDQLRVAVNTIRQLKGLPSHALRQYLETGYTTQPQYADKNGKRVPAGTPNSRPIPGTGGTKIPRISHAGPIGAHDLINAAFDIAAFGRLSGPNRRALRGVRLPAPWLRPAPRQRRLTQREIQHGG